MKGKRKRVSSWLWVTSVNLFFNTYEIQGHLLLPLYSTLHIPLVTPQCLLNKVQISWFVGGNALPTVLFPGPRTLLLQGMQTWVTSTSPCISLPESLFLDTRAIFAGAHGKAEMLRNYFLWKQHSRNYWGMVFYNTLQSLHPSGAKYLRNVFSAASEFTSETEL